MNVPNNFQAIRGWWIPVCIALWFSVMAGCSNSVERKWDSPVRVPPSAQETPQPSPSGQETAPAIAPQTLIQPVEQPIIQSSETSDSFQTIWVVTRREGLPVDDLLRRAQEAHVSHILLGGDVLRSVDDILLNPEKRDWIQRFVQEAGAEQIKVMLVSREINQDGQTFLFNQDSPLVFARQEAYRRAIRMIPDLDGIVLSFPEASLPPWNVVIPEGNPALAVPERIRFVIDSIRPLVRQELGKNFYVALSGTSEQQGWIADALQVYGRDDLGIWVPYASSQSALVQETPAIPAKISDFPTVFQIDLSGRRFGGPDGLMALWDQWQQWFSWRKLETVRGLAIRVDGDSGSLFDSVNSINMAAFSKVVDNVAFDFESVSSEWIANKFGFIPMTREGQTLQSLYRSTVLWNERIYWLKDLVQFGDRGDIPKPEDWPQIVQTLSRNDLSPQIVFLLHQMVEPDSQTMIDLAQESWEANELLDQSLSDLESIRNQMNPELYNDLYKRLKSQRFLADIFFYTKQSIWGYTFWQRTKNEDEALYLEANLQQLERLASILEQRSEPILPPCDPARIRAWVGTIRQTFPKVIMGWKEREWNRLHNIVIRQTGPANIEIIWNSQEPCTSKVFLATSLPVFSRMTEVSNFPVKEHKAYLSDLESGKKYFIKIQCVNTENKVTNSGIYPFQLEGTPAS